MAKTYTGEPMAPDHPLGGIYAIMDRHGMLPDEIFCLRCAKPLNADGGHPAELYAGTYNGLCYGCTSAGPYVAAVQQLDGGQRVSWPPPCPSYRRTREDHYGYPDCASCHGLGATGYTSSPKTCEACYERYRTHPVTAAAWRWLEQVARSCQATFELAWDHQAGVPRKCSKKRQAELRAAYAGPDRDHQTPEFAALKADYTAGYNRIRAQIKDHFTARGWQVWTEPERGEEFLRSYCRWRGMDYAAMKDGGPVVYLPGREPQPEPDPREARVRLLRSLTWERAEALYRRGDISQIEFEAFGYAWRRGAARFGSTGLGMEHPVDEPVRELGNAIMGDAAPGTCPCSAGENCRS